MDKTLGLSAGISGVQILPGSSSWCEGNIPILPFYLQNHRPVNIASVYSGHLRTKSISSTVKDEIYSLRSQRSEIWRANFQGTQCPPAWLGQAMSTFMSTPTHMRVDMIRGISLEDTHCWEENLCLISSKWLYYSSAILPFFLIDFVQSSIAFNSIPSSQHLVKTFQHCFKTVQQ